MHNKPMTNGARAIYLMLLLCFSAAMFYCGDAECLNGSSDENCAALLCSLLSKHTNASPDGSNNDEDNCSCVCHLPTMLPTGFSLVAPFLTSSHSQVLNAALTSAPSRLVYHPPLAV